MSGINKLIDGYKTFYQRYFVDNDQVYKKLSKDGQSPIAVVIACSDSRADPSHITGAEPGELFVIRNVANLVPPYQDDNTTYHGTSAALEFAINILNIKNVIVFGHSKCAGIKALVDHDFTPGNKSFVDSWMSMASDVKKSVMAEYAHLDKTEQTHICETKAIEKSLQNLTSFPWINDKITSGEISLHGWYFDIHLGQLMEFNAKTKEWNAIVDRRPMKLVTKK